MHRVILDTNVVVRGVVNAGSSSGHVMSLCDSRHVIPLLSKSVLSEYRSTLADPEIVARYPELKSEMIEKVLSRLIYIGDMVRQVRARFYYPRDPKDSRFIELAIVGGATAIVTCDLDLLDLPNGRDDAAKRFRQRLSIDVVTPGRFLEIYRQSSARLN